jgi:hypothetical protein
LKFLGTKVSRFGHFLVFRNIVFEISMFQGFTIVMFGFKGFKKEVALIRNNFCYTYYFDIRLVIRRIFQIFNRNQVFEFEFGFRFSRLLGSRRFNYC